MGRLQKLDDIELIKLYLEHHNQSYFEELYDRYANKVYSKCYSLLRTKGVAEDATQDIFTKIFLRLSTFNQQSRFSTWVYAVTYNYCIDHIRKQKKQRYIFTGDEQEVPDVPEDIDDAEIVEMEIERLDLVMDKISKSDRKVLIMKYKEGMPIKEIALQMKKSESAIKMKIKRAKAKVRKHYMETFASVLLLLLSILFK